MPSREKPVAFKDVIADGANAKRMIPRSGSIATTIRSVSAFGKA